MKTIEELLTTFNDEHPVAASLLYFAVVLILLAVLIWFLLFSGMNTTADFVYNQF